MGRRFPDVVSPFCLDVLHWPSLARVGDGPLLVHHGVGRRPSLAGAGCRVVVVVVVGKPIWDIVGGGGSGGRTSSCK